MESTASPAPPHVVIFPTAGMGHLIPIGELAKRLIPRGFSFTFAIPSDIPPTPAQLSYLSDVAASTAGAIDAIHLPPVDISDLPSDAKIETRMSHIVIRSLPSLRELLGEIKKDDKKKRASVFLADLFGTDTFEVAREFHLRPYLFMPSTAMLLSLFLYLDELDASVACEYRELEEPVMIPGCVPVHGGELLDPTQDRKDEAYKWILHHARRYRLAEGIVENSFEAVEPGPIKALSKPEPGRPPVYFVGPLVRPCSEGQERDGDHQVTKWLDEQPDGSVLFVSFGSAGNLTLEQQNELAHGLEMSNQRFLWVVRTPNSSASNSNYFSIDAKRDPLAYLPEGFVERTRGRGLVVPLWAPQMKILGHGATGGFLSHCGWNSTLESVVSGVPMITWPLFAEQKMNRVILAEDLKVALRVVTGEDGLIGRDEIARVAKGLMEGEEGKKMRRRMLDLKDAASMALSDQGSSTKALDDIALKWKSPIS